MDKTLCIPAGAQIGSDCADCAGTGHVVRRGAVQLLCVHGAKPGNETLSTPPEKFNRVSRS
jgi:hypothetical protein